MVVRFRLGREKRVALELQRCWRGMLGRHGVLDNLRGWAQRLILKGVHAVRAKCKFRRRKRHVLRLLAAHPDSVLLRKLVSKLLGMQHRLGPLELACRQPHVLLQRGA